MTWALALIPHPGIVYLIVAVALLVALGTLVSGEGWRRFAGPLVIVGLLGSGWYLQAQKAPQLEKVESDFAATCKEARSEVRRTVRGVNEVFVEEGGEKGLPHVGKHISGALLGESPRFARVAVPATGPRSGEVAYVEAQTDEALLRQKAPPARVETLPQYGVRWRFEPPRADGVEPYRMEIFDRVSGEVLATQQNFRYQDPKVHSPRNCPITDPADLVRSVLLAGKA